MAFLASACADSDENPTGSAGASSGGAGHSGAAGRAGAGGGSAGAPRGGSSGSGEVAGEAGTPSGEGGDSSAGAANGGSAGDDGSAGQGGAPSTSNCLPDGTTLQVTASGASAYVFGGLPPAWSDGAGDNNAPLTLCRGYTYTFALNVIGHPFYIKTTAGTGTANAYATGVTGNGNSSGNLVFVVPAAAPAALVYQCSVHVPMTGTITIVDPS